jgi:hypothetical protein
MLCVFTLFKSLKSMYHCKEEGMSVKERIRNEIFQLASECGFIKPAQQSYSENILNQSLHNSFKKGILKLANIPLYSISKVPNSEDVMFNRSAKSLGDIVLDSTKIQHEHKIKIADKNIKWDAPFIEEGFYTGYEYGDFNDLRVDFAYEDEDQNTITMGKLMGIEVIDHVIIGDGYFSFMDQNMMPVWGYVSLTELRTQYCHKINTNTTAKHNIFSLL